MELKIVRQKENPILARKELDFTIRHDGATTPSRAQARQLVAAEIGTKTENVIIDHMASEYGLGSTAGSARAYKTPEAARGQERVHLLKRNSLYVEKAKKAKKEGEEAAPAKPKGGA
ncbi:MAG: 30S ribosomal protein S24e [Thermoplasmatota archaeon]